MSHKACDEPGCDRSTDMRQHVWHWAGLVDSRRYWSYVKSFDNTPVKIETFDPVKALVWDKNKRPHLE